MDINIFWQIVDTGKESDRPEEVLAAELSKLEAEAIAEFQQHFDTLFNLAYRWDLWGAAYLLGGGCSDDGFMDFRDGLIAKGRQVFEHAMDNPDNLAEFAHGPDIENEAFGYVATSVYENKTSNQMPSTVSSSADPTGEEWDFDDDSENAKRLPEITSILS